MDAKAKGHKFIVYESILRSHKLKKRQHMKKAFSISSNYSKVVYVCIVTITEYWQ